MPYCGSTSMRALWRRPGRHDFFRQLRPAILRASVSTFQKPGKDDVGLFGLVGLHKPSDWEWLASTCISKCRTIVKRCLSPGSPSPAILQHYDDLSDEMCKVLDCAELCRNVHPDPEFCDAASQAFAHVSSYMQELNADVDLYSALMKLENSEVVLDEEERIMCRSLRTDFERGGIHLPTDRRNKLVELQNEMHELGAVFNANIHTYAGSKFLVHLDRLKPLPHHFFSKLARRSSTDSRVELPLTPSLVTTILQWTADPEIRRQVYEASVCPPNVPVLEQLLKVRSRIASMLGYENYLDLSISDRVATSSNAIRAFLEDLSEQVKSKAESELSLLKAAKIRLEGHDAGQKIFPWDRSFYTSLVKDKISGDEQSLLHEHFHLNACLDGLRIIMSSLFGIDMQQCDVSTHEIWSDDVTKMELRHETEGVLGYIYFDLFPRPGKYNHAAHFTIRGGRMPGAGMEYQKPVVALVCNFSRQWGSSVAVLSHGEFETLLHEFGHAVHSVLARTKFHNLCGTRGAVDFVEIPSHLFEHFAWDHRVLKRFAKHASTHNTLPAEDLESMRKRRQSFAAMDIQQQIMLSAMDLEFHTLSPTSDWTEVFAQVQRRYTCVSPGSQVPWQTTFGHVVGYGAGYYSYMVAKVFAAEIWQLHFEKNPFSREAGDKLRHRLLKFGGSRNPRELIESVTGPTASLLSYMKECGVVDMQGDGVTLDRTNFPFRF